MLHARGCARPWQPKTAETMLFQSRASYRLYPHPPRSVGDDEEAPPEVEQT